MSSSDDDDKGGDDPTQKKRPLDDDNEEEENAAADSPQEATKIRTKRIKKIPLDIPLSSHYHVSWMHVAVITCVCTSIKHGYVVTGDAQGVVKFWKRLPVKQQSAAAAAAATASGKKNVPQQHPCLEFVKSFTAHSDAVLA